MSDPIGRGLLGSIRRRVTHEIKLHMASNPAMRGGKYSIAQRALRMFFADHSFQWFICLYLYINLLAVFVEFAFDLWIPQWAQNWTSDNMKGLLNDTAGYFITAQVGILGVVSVAVGLVTLIAQRNDSASSNTDVRLYYVEALAYELVSSSAALLIILCVQTFWPLQFILHSIGFGGSSLYFKVFMTGCHILWLSINLVGFAHFITTTLQFVEPTARAKMRERYTANVIVPEDLRARLLFMFYEMASTALVPQKDSKSGPLIALGHTLADLGTIELRTEFAHRAVLQDVRLWPLGLALRRWWQRTERTAEKQTKARQRNTFGRDVSLAINLSFDRDFQGDVVWCRRHGGVPLTNFELWLIRKSFCFSRPSPRTDTDLPTPATFLEEMADQAIGRIERSAVTGFRAALDEMIRYHRFLLDLHDTRSQEGRPLSLAEVGGLWQRPHQEWVRQYRRIYEQAAQHLVSDPSFVEIMGYVPMRLLPRSAVETSTPVVRSILDLSMLLVIFLEAWVTQRTTSDTLPGEVTQPRATLPGSDRRAYEQVLLHVVGSWENTLRMGRSLYNWKAVQDASPHERWTALTTSWPFFECHLQNTAYFLAIATWNEDPLGVERYRDMLLRWFTTIKPGSSEVYLHMRHKCLLTPDWFSLDWTTARTQLEPFLTNTPHMDIAPETLFFVILRRAFDDALAVSAAVTLSWYMRDQQVTNIGGTTAALLMRRQLIEGDGTDPVANAEGSTIGFHWIFDMIVREAVSQQVPGGPYGSALDGLVGTLNQMSERRAVPGRVYSSWGGTGLDSVLPQLIVLLLATLPEVDDAGVLAELAAIASDEVILPNGDQSLQRIVSSIDRLKKALDQEAGQPALEKGLAVLLPNGDIAVSVPRLRTVLTQAVATIEERRTETLRRLPLNAEKMDKLREMLVSTQCSVAEELFPFKNIKFSQTDLDGATVQEFSVKLDKGDLSDPSMSHGSSGLEDVIASCFRDILVQQVNWKFFREPRKIAHLSGPYPDQYWQQVAAEHALMDVPAVLLVPYDPVGADVTKWMYGQANDKPTNLNIESLNRYSGGGLGYIATINGLDVYATAYVEKHSSFLIPTESGASIIYSNVPGTGSAIIFELKNDENPREATLVIKYSLEVNWNPSPHVEFVFHDADQLEPGDALSGS